MRYLWLRGTHIRIQQHHSLTVVGRHQYSIDNIVSNSVSVPFNYTVVNRYGVYFERQLVLSSDVGLKPGPLKDKEEILCS